MHTRGGMLILRLTLDVGLIDLDGSEHETVLAMGEGGRGCGDLVAKRTSD